MEMYLRDGHVYTTWGNPLRDDGLVVSRHDLASEIGYINAHNIAYVDVFTGDPRMIVDRAFREARLQELQSTGSAESASDYLTDIAPLRNCPHLTQLSLCGDLTGSEVLAELPNLRCLSLDNTLGKHKVDLSPLSLHTLYIQKPGRNVCGYEQIISLRELAIWNYQPKIPRPVRAGQPDPSGASAPDSAAHPRPRRRGAPAVAGQAGGVLYAHTHRRIGASSLRTPH